MDERPKTIDDETHKQDEHNSHSIQYALYGQMNIFFCTHLLNAFKRVQFAVVEKPSIVSHWLSTFYQAEYMTEKWRTGEQVRRN